MRMKTVLGAVVGICLTLPRETNSDPVIGTITILSVLLGMGIHWFSPDCSKKAIPFNTNSIHQILTHKVFGQPLIEHLSSILEGHRRSFDQTEGTKKALSVSLHGWPGTGKNYVAGFLAEALFTGGLDSPYVKLYIGRNDFPHKSRVKEYQDRLKREIRELVFKCGKALIIFDEVNDIVPEVLDVLHPLMDFHPSVDGVDYRNAIFIFLSNINGNEIVKRMTELQKPRSSLTLSDFDNVMREGAYNSKGGFKDASIIFSHLIDHYIPFLPLEQSHVRRCVEKEFQLNYKNVKVTEQKIQEAMSVITYGPPDNPIYSNSGCKRVKKQVSRVAASIKV